MTSNLAITASPKADTMTWHTSVVKNAVFGWKTTDLSPTNPDMPFDMGGQTLNVDDPIFFKFNDDPPTNPGEFFGSAEAPNFIDMYIKDKQVSWDDIAQQSVIFLGLVLPIEYTYDNGTSIGLDEIVKLGQPQDYTVNVTDQNSYVDVDVTVPSGVIQAYYKITKSTGVASELTVSIVFYGSITWEYDASLTLSEDGSSESSEDGADSPIPGFEVLPLMAALSLSAFLVYRKHRNQ
ncbi:MAG: hypothetical protein ACXAB4_07825 [Candidatus Hodarchaeales archaeon]